MSAVQIFPSGDVREAPDPDDLIEHGPYELLVWARKQKTGHSTRKLVLKSLVERANSHGVTWVGQDALAEDCEVDVSTIRRVLRELEDQGLIGRFKRYEAVGGRKLRTSDVTIIGPSLPEHYRSKCTVGLTRENANDDLPGTGTTKHGCAVDLTCDDTEGEVLPLTGATKHPCLDLPCTGAQSVPLTGARGITMVEVPVLYEEKNQGEKAPAEPPPAPTLPIDVSSTGQPKPVTQAGQRKNLPDPELFGYSLTTRSGVVVSGQTMQETLFRFHAAVTGRPLDGKPTGPQRELLNSIFPANGKRTLEEAAHCVEGAALCGWAPEGFSLSWVFRRIGKTGFDASHLCDLEAAWERGGPEVKPSGYRLHKADPGGHAGPTGRMPSADKWREIKENDLWKLPPWKRKVAP